MPRGLALLAAGGTVAGLLTGCATIRPTGPGPSQTAAKPGASATRARTTPASAPSVGAPSVGAVPMIGSDPARLAVQLVAAEMALSRTGVAAALARQGPVVPLTCLKPAAA